MCRSGTSRSPLSLVVGEGGRRKDGGKLYISTVLPNGVCYSTATIRTLASTATIRTLASTATIRTLTSTQVHTLHHYRTDRLPLTIVSIGYDPSLNLLMLDVTSVSERNPQ